MKANASIGLKQVDIYAGLNVMSLLLKLHRYAQERNDLKQQIHFYPLREQDVKNTPKDQVLRIIYYSDSIKLGTFCSVVGRFLSAADLQRADLQRADLSYAKNLNPEQVQSANNWKEAKYSEEFRAQLGLPPEPGN